MMVVVVVVVGVIVTAAIVSIIILVVVVVAQSVPMRAPRPRHTMRRTAKKVARRGLEMHRPEWSTPTDVLPVIARK
jgi:hypothetical protein